MTMYQWGMSKAVPTSILSDRTVGTVFGSFNRLGPGTGPNNPGDFYGSGNASVFDGNFSKSIGSQTFLGAYTGRYDGVNVTNQYIGKLMPAGVLIDKVTLYSSNNLGFDIQNNNDSMWIDLYATTATSFPGPTSGTFLGRISFTNSATLLTPTITNNVDRTTPFRTWWCVWNQSPITSFSSFHTAQISLYELV